MRITVLPARADNGEVIPGLFQGALTAREDHGPDKVKRLSPKRLPYGEAFADAHSMLHA